MRSVFLRKGAAGLLAALLAVPVVAPLACEVPAEAAIDQLDGDRMSGFEATQKLASWPETRDIPVLPQRFRKAGEAAHVGKKNGDLAVRTAER